MPFPLQSKPLLSICIPAHNEEKNIDKTIDVISSTLVKAEIPYEFVIANDNSSDGTEAVIRRKMDSGIPITLVNRTPPGGFGRAVRSCLNHFRGDVVVIVMADLSDDPNDIVRYYHKMNEGYDAIFGSRFMKGSVVKDYPFVKLMANRLGNKLIQLMFKTKHNDLTNAFKAFRGDAIRSVMPFYSAHFNLTIEISLALLVRGFKIGVMPINWYGRTWGSAHFKIRELGRRYFATLCKVYAEWIFIHDDVISEHKGVLKQMSLMHPKSVNSETVISNSTNEEHSNNWRGRVRGV